MNKKKREVEVNWNMEMASGNAVYPTENLPMKSFPSCFLRHWAKHIFNFIIMGIFKPPLFLFGVFSFIIPLSEYDSKRFFQLKNKKNCFFIFEVFHMSAHRGCRTNAPAL